MELKDWLVIIAIVIGPVESGLIKQNPAAGLIKEANELTAIFTASRKTAKGRERF